MNNAAKRNLTTKLYLLDCMPEEDHEGNELNTARERIAFCKERFESEYQWRVDQYGEATALKDWLLGLAINVEYANHKIIALGKDWEIIPQDATEKQEDKLLEDYWPYLATKLGQMFRNTNTPKDLFAQWEAAQ